MKLALVALTGLAGCNAAFGISTFTTPPDAEPDAPPDAAADAPPGDLLMTGSIAQTFIYNSASLTPTRLRTIFPATSVKLTVEDAVTGAQTMIPYDDTTGSFTVPYAPGTRPRVEAHFGASINEFQWGLPKLTMNFLAYTRPGAVVTAANTSFTGSYTPAGALAQPTLFATGIWQAVGITATAATSTYTVPWAGYLEAGTGHDQLIFANYDRDANGNLVLDKKQAINGVDMVNGAANTLAFALAPLPPDSCASATTSAAANTARLMALSTSFGSAPTSAALVVYSIPAPDVGPSGAFELAQSPVGADPAMLPYSSTMFPGSMPIIASQAARARLVNGVSIGTAIIRYAMPIDKTCGMTLAFPAITAAFATDFVIADTQVADGDGTSIHFTTPTAVVSWTANGPSDLYLVQILDVTQKAYLAHNIYTTIAQVAIDPAELVVGHQYVVVVSSTVGLSQIADGDLITHGYPFERGVSVSPIFTVQ